MDLADKIVNALRESMTVEYIRLDTDDDISGFVVSPRFRDLDSLDRQTLIDSVLDKSLSPQEHRQVLMIAAVTPEEYDFMGARIRIHRIKDLGGGLLRILLHGGLSDAKYVRGALTQRPGVQTTTPEQVPGALGILMSFEAKSTKEPPITKDQAIEILKKDRYIDVMAGV